MSRGYLCGTAREEFHGRTPGNRNRSGKTVPVIALWHSVDGRGRRILMVGNGIIDSVVLQSVDESTKKGSIGMCLAVPMQLVEITGENVGKVNSGGVRTDVSLIMLPQAKVGDYIIVHAGFGIEVLDAEEAQIRLDLFTELAEATAHLEDA
jgi:hydrogenase expression/formation protein HypC